MPSKEEILKGIEDSNRATWAKSEVRHMVNGISTKYKAPLIFKKGDVVKTKIGLNNKVRPAVIIKVLNGLVITIPLSTTENEINLLGDMFHSRFFENSYFSKGLVCITIEEARENFLGVYDNMKAVNLAIKEMKSLISKL